MKGTRAVHDMWMLAPRLIDLFIQAEVEDVLSLFFRRVVSVSRTLKDEHVHREVSRADQAGKSSLRRVSSVSEAS